MEQVILDMKVANLLEGLSKPELQKLNMAVVGALAKINKAERLELIKQFTVGETVSFVTQSKMFKGQTIIGELKDIVADRATVFALDCKQGMWHVSPIKLQKVG